ncbi:unnamed protein product [Soboliphyme baturini]|uniref:Phosphoribosylaminoimidazolesuccinocarboxamide synthase n=1 Tax=Soboliphyme baturini TaxID=241478 RepID=A0A183J577_9BILA|nr:unnamed protein product [Soboliphyme baturini]
MKAVVEGGIDGFRSKYCTIGNLLTLNQLLERAREHNLPSGVFFDVFFDGVLFVDFEMTPDNVELNAVLKDPVEGGIDESCVEIMKEAIQDI